MLLITFCILLATLNTYIQYSCTIEHSYNICCKYVAKTKVRDSVKSETNLKDVTEFVGFFTIFVKNIVESC